MAAFSVLDNYPYALSSPDDQGLFQRIAMNLLNRGAFSGSLSGPAVFCPTRPPLYPLILALTWKISGGMSLLPIRIIQVVSYLLTLYLISQIASMVAGGDRKYGLFSALFASIIPFAAAATHVILTESLTLFFLTMAVFLAVKYRTKPSRFFLLLLGISLGLLVLQRPTFMLIPVVFLGYVLLSPKITKRNIIPVALLIMLPLTAVVAPWSLYARSETGSCALVRTGVGFNLMQGIVRSSPPLLDKFFDDFRHFQAGDFDKNEMTGRIDALLHSKEDIPTQAGYFSPDIARLIDFALATYIATWHPQPPDPHRVIKCDLFLKKAASSWIRHYPLSFLRIVSANLNTLLLGDFQPLVYRQMEGYPYLYTAAVERVLWLLFAASTLVLLRRRQLNIVFFPLAIVLYLIIVHWPMHTEPRYFIYAYTFMPIAVAALVPGRLPRNESGPHRPGHHG